jgi:hypothetical protein
MEQAMDMSIGKRCMPSVLPDSNTSRLSPQSRFP